MNCEAPLVAIVTHHCSILEVSVNTSHLANISISSSVVTSSPTPVMTSSMGRAAANGGMVTAHEVPIYAKVERIASPPPPRIRPFSFGEASNSSNTSQNEVCISELLSN